MKACLDALSADGANQGLRALAHITGGGLVENLPRVLPENAAAQLDAGSWRCPPVFAWLAESGGIEEAEMLRTFNCGIGMVAVVAKDRIDAIGEAFEKAGEAVQLIGEIVPRESDAPAVEITGRLTP